MNASISEKYHFLSIPEPRLEKIATLAANFDPLAHSEINSLKVEYPKSPLPLILKLKQLYWEQYFVSYEQDLIGQFEKKALETLTQLNSISEYNQYSLDTTFSIAYTKGLLGKFYLERGRKGNGFRTTSAAIRAFKRLLKQQSDFHEAKLSVGLAYCYNFDQIPTLKNLFSSQAKQTNLDRGLALISEASIQSSFSKGDALFCYAKILHEELSEEKQAKTALNQLLSNYPRNLHYRTVLADLERSTRDFQSCCNHAEKVLSDNRITDFPGIEVQALNNLMWGAYEIEDYEISLKSALRLQELANAYPQLSTTKSWATLAEAESLYALGFHKKATDRWMSIPTSHPIVYRKAQTQLSDKISTPSDR